MIAHPTQHFSSNPVMRIDDGRLYLPFARGYIIARNIRPHRITSGPRDRPLTLDSIRHRELWWYRILGVMARRDQYRDLRREYAIDSVRRLRRLESRHESVLTEKVIARHLADCGITEDDMADAFAWARAMIDWLIINRSNSDQDWQQLRRQVTMSGVDWAATPAGWPLYYPAHPTSTEQTASGSRTQMDPPSPAAATDADIQMTTVEPQTPPGTPPTTATTTTDTATSNTNDTEMTDAPADPSPPS
jgi:hypothetical protein